MGGHVRQSAPLLLLRLLQKGSSAQLQANAMVTMAMIAMTLLQETELAMKPLAWLRSLLLLHLRVAGAALPELHLPGLQLQRRLRPAKMTLGIVIALLGQQAKAEGFQRAKARASRMVTMQTQQPAAMMMRMRMMMTRMRMRASLAARARAEGEAEAEGAGEGQLPLLLLLL